MLDFLPVIGTVAAGPVIGAVVILLVKVGLLKSETAQIVATIVGGMIWAGLVMSMGAFPDVAPYVVAVVEFIAALLGAAGVQSARMFGFRAFTVE